MKTLSGLLCICLTIAAQSPPQRQIAFAIEFEQGLRLVNAETGSISVIDTGLDFLEDIGSCKGSDLLAMDGEIDRRYRFYLLHLGNGQKDLLQDASAGESYLSPTFSADCGYLYAVSMAVGVVRFSVSQKRWERIRITGASVPIVQQVAFSKSGRTVAISPERYNEFLIARNEGNRLVVERSVLKEFYSCLSPVWVGDEAILFVGRRAKDDDVQRLWKYEVVTGEVRPLTQSPLATRDRLSLSSDEKTIVLSATDGTAGGRGLWTVSVNGTRLRRLTHSKEWVLSSAWVE
jgi:Tol biopolymer transport system component